MEPKEKTPQFISLREMCFVATFTAVIVVLAQLSIPMPLGVPLTLQTFGVMLAGIVLGAKKAAIALVVYLLLGAAGAPVFTQFGGGFARIIGPWGGFLLSCPFVAFVVGLGSDSGNKQWLAAALAAGVIINLSAGTLQFAFVSGVGLREAFLAAFAPFIVVEAIKIIMAFAAGLPVKAALKRSGLL